MPATTPPEHPINRTLDHCKWDKRFGQLVEHLSPIPTEVLAEQRERFREEGRRGKTALHWQAARLLELVINEREYEATIEAAGDEPEPAKQPARRARKAADKEPVEA